MSRQILVCDDEPHILRAISLKLTRAGFDLKNVSDVETCWRLLQRDEPPALLIVDRTFPTGADGVHLVRRMRQDARFVDLPVVMLFASQTEVTEQEASLVDLKLAQVVAKPFSPRELLEAVNQLVGREREAGVATHR